MTTTRLSFDLVAFEATKHFGQPSSIDEVDDAIERFNSIVEACGWSIEDFEQEQLSRIEESWPSP